MAYQITRKNRIKEELQLCHEDGTVAVTIPVDINVDAMGARINKTYENLGNAQYELKKNPNGAEAIEAVGKAIISLFNVIFGEDGTKTIVEFYEGNYSEMLLDLFPFINNEILPKVKAASEQRKAQLVAAAQAVGVKNKRRWRR